MFNPDGCFCCEPPEDPCTMTGCTWSSTDMSDTDLTAGTTYNNPSSGSTPDGTYEVTNVQDTSTGNDAPCRKITIETAVAPSKAESVYAICWKDNATHNPSTQCPLTNVSFCVESKRHADADSGLTDGVVFVVRQNGKIYATATQAVGVNWKRASGTYTSASFTWVNGAGNPNFTATGTAIEFGFALKLAVPKNESPFDVVMFDNLCIKKTVNCGLGFNQCAGPCEFEYNGDGGVSIAEVVDDGSGDISVSLSGSQSIGWTPPSYKLTFTPSNPSQASMAGYVYSVIGLDGCSFQPLSGCNTVSRISVCFNLMYESDFSDGVVWAFLCVDQGGQKYACSFGSYITAGGGVGRASASVPAGSLRRITGYQFVPSSSGGSPYISLTTVSEYPDFQSAFSVGLIFAFSAGQSHGQTQNYVHNGRLYFDNICVKASTGGCPLASTLYSDNIQISVDSPLFDSGASGYTATHAAVNSMLAGGIILTRPSVVYGANVWGYRLLFDSPTYAGKALVDFFLNYSTSSCVPVLRLYVYDEAFGGGTSTTTFHRSARPRFASTAVTSCDGDMTFSYSGTDGDSSMLGGSPSAAFTLTPL